MTKFSDVKLYSRSTKYPYHFKLLVTKRPKVIKKVKYLSVTVEVEKFPGKQHDKEHERDVKRF